jgi:hypothetical protein
MPRSTDPRTPGLGTDLLHGTISIHSLPMCSDTSILMTPTEIDPCCLGYARSLYSRIGLVCVCVCDQEAFLRCSSSSVIKPFDTRINHNTPFTSHLTTTGQSFSLQTFHRSLLQPSQLLSLGPLINSTSLTETLNLLKPHHLDLQTREGYHQDL